VQANGGGVIPGSWVKFVRIWAEFQRGVPNAPRRYYGFTDSYFCEFAYGFRCKLLKQLRQIVALL